MNVEDKIIEKFFQEMKGQDEKVVIPLAPTRVHKKKQSWIPYSIAASILLLAVSYFIFQQTKKEEGYTLNIILETVTINATESLVDHDIPFDKWESPTQSLIEDF